VGISAYTLEKLNIKNINIRIFTTKCENQFSSSIFFCALFGKRERKIWM